MRVFVRLMLLGSIAMAVGPVRALADPAPAADKANPAPAADKAKDKEKEKVAKQYVAAGLAAQNSGDYDTALIFYSKAYQLVPHPLLIFNMAQAHRLAGRIEKALALYAKYLAEDPSGAQAQTVRDIVAEIDAKKAEAAKKAEDAKQAEAARKAEDAKQAEDARRSRELEASRAAEQKRAADAAPSPQEPATPGPTDQAPGRTLRLSGFATGAVGVVSLGLGVGFGLHARSLSSELSKPGATYSTDKVHSGETANKVAITGLIGGTVLVAAGATLYWLGHSQEKRPEGVTLAPMVSDHLAGLVVAGTLP